MMTVIPFNKYKEKQMQESDKKTILVLNPEAYPEEYSKVLRLSPFGYIEKLREAIEKSERITDDCVMVDHDVTL